MVLQRAGSVSMLLISSLTVQQWSGQGWVQETGIRGTFCVCPALHSTVIRLLASLAARGARTGAPAASESSATCRARAARVSGRSSSRTQIHRLTSSHGEMQPGSGRCLWQEA